MAERLVRVYSRFNRLWHWSQVGSILILLFTGFRIMGLHQIMPYGPAVVLHSAVALALLLLWAFATFWLFTTGAWKQYLPTREGLDTPRASARARSPSRWLDVSWPQPLRPIETGVAGPAARPVLWYRFGLDGQRPEDAVKLALDALEEQSTGEPLRSVHADPDSGRVVGQLRAERFAASAVAEDSTSSRELRVTIELLD